ncbi:MAG: quinone-dependent dihydroorotate dehydrogenase [Alphaproteobacteria bacterium]|nr:MAG: quinone-dependent dihydroorotate dehydrogenase [Alphaproteobacteria bacterium]
MDMYRRMISPLLFTLSPETAHRAAVFALAHLPFLFPRAQVPELPITLWGRRFDNPVGLAAGFDKDAEAWRGLSRLGFGFLELGTVTPKPQPGNPKPRIFRDSSTQSVINRMGFPGKGAAHFKDGLRGRESCPVPLGINIGKNKATEDFDAIVDDYKSCIRMLGGLADYFVVNVSSPNTPGLRALQSKEALSGLLTELMQVKDTQIPLLVKIAPDLSEQELEEIAAVVTETACDGIVISNTTLARPDVLPQDFAAEQGGLSGALLRDKATQMIARFYALTDGEIPVIGAGGVSSGADVYQKIRAGASLVQIYTGMIFVGPYVAARAVRELSQIIAAEGISDWTQIIGIDSARYMR